MERVRSREQVGASLISKIGAAVLLSFTRMLLNSHSFSLHFRNLNEEFKAFGFEYSSSSLSHVPCIPFYPGPELHLTQKHRSPRLVILHRSLLKTSLGEGSADESAKVERVDSLIP